MWLLVFRNLVMKVWQQVCYLFPLGWVLKLMLLFRTLYNSHVVIYNSCEVCVLAVYCILLHTTIHRLVVNHHPSMEQVNLYCVIPSEICTRAAIVAVAMVGSVLLIVCLWYNKHSSWYYTVPYLCKDDMHSSHCGFAWSASAIWYMEKQTQ